VVGESKKEGKKRGSGRQFALHLISRERRSLRKGSDPGIDEEGAIGFRRGGRKTKNLRETTKRWGEAPKKPSVEMRDLRQELDRRVVGGFLGGFARDRLKKREEKGGPGERKDVLRDFLVSLQEGRIFL